MKILWEENFETLDGLKCKETCFKDFRVVPLKQINRPVRKNMKISTIEKDFSIVKEEYQIRKYELCAYDVIDDIHGFPIRVESFYREIENE